MSASDLTINSADWRRCEPITLDRQKDTLSMPEGLEPRPGLYKLVFHHGEKFYFGEAGDIHRRIGDYIVYYEGTGIESEFRINRALNTFGGAEVWTFYGDDNAGAGVQTRSQRCTIEHRLIKEAGNRALNGGSIEDKIAFHASEIIRLTKKLPRLTPM